MKYNLSVGSLAHYIEQAHEYYNIVVIIYIFG